MAELIVFETAGEIADYTFELLVRTAASAEAGRAAADTAAALSFGSTYEGIFRRWRELYEKTGRPLLPALFPADERLVDIGDAASNWGIVRRLFIDCCGTKEDRGRWASDAEVYRRMLDKQFGKTGNGLPQFEIIFLGLGPDGHTASLFPGSCPPEGTKAWNESVLETTAPFLPPKRLTLGPEVIASARNLVLTVTGAGKAEIFARFHAELEGADKTLPPSLILARRAELGLNTVILLDKAAAEKTEVKI